MLICFMKEGITSLGKMEKTIILDEINIKYNFIISNSSNNERINVDCSSQGSYIMFLYPDVLDFTYPNSLNILFLIRETEYLNGLRFNLDGEDLKCKYKGIIKTCVVPKSHFNGKKSSFYFSHKNHLKEQPISCEIPPVKVI